MLGKTDEQKKKIQDEIDNNITKMLQLSATKSPSNTAENDQNKINETNVNMPELLNEILRDAQSLSTGKHQIKLNVNVEIKQYYHLKE